MKKNKIVKVLDLGFKPYAESLTIQEDYFNQIIDLKRSNRNKERQDLTDNYLLWVEHPPVFTLGKSGKIEHLLVDQAALEQKGIQFFKTNRGGDITFHGPGQLVAYPIFDLDNFFTDIHKYLRFLEEAIIKTLEEFGLSATRSPGETGVWLDEGTPFARKICAMGVRASRWVTMHGLALNLNTDLSYFDHIVPCGIQGKGVTSLAKELGKPVDAESVKEKLKLHLGSLFEIEEFQIN
ncbi:lipoyl(octanoyl) transferase LipB [Flavobacteriaceae bacterium]|jgi:lipoyl(octanoyl) transferase|nr:lipoyl(octanoyl) transferase LipB [Flavobacteriaceae bacterium]MDA9878802.1 lipoyl(octanoyl) transferase LipB [Flavobacteriaceae bacterium]MDB2328089.1 lipoyl(octanoyl) transferase LipB [Flavobacteriaceae bacterium]